jgi:hypothetical protein
VSFDLIRYFINVLSEMAFYVLLFVPWWRPFAIGVSAVLRAILRKQLGVE